MKQTLFDNRKFTVKDFIFYTLILLLHYIGFGIYFLLLSFLMYLDNGNMWVSFEKIQRLLIYPFTLGPIVNFGLHVYYSERGAPAIRFTMWAHSISVAIIISLIVF